MARYSIEDTTLTALGDATRRFTTETRVEEWDQYEWEEELPLHGGMNNGGYDGWYPVEHHLGYDPYNCYLSVKNPERGYTFKFMSLEDRTDWDPMVESEVRVPTNTTIYITRTDTLEDDICILVYRYTDSNDEPMGKHYSQTVTNTLTPGQMAEVLNNYDLSGMIPASALEITGNCQHKFAQGGWDWFINQMGDKITTKNINSADSMFYYSNVEEIPFAINMSDVSSSYSKHNMHYMFFQCQSLKEAPMVYQAYPENISGLFDGCYKMTSIPEGFAEDWNWSEFDNETNSYGSNNSGMFSSCKRLRAIPKVLLSHGNLYSTNTYVITNNGFSRCNSLEKIEDVFIPYLASYTSSWYNCFSYGFDYCNRLKKLTLATQEDGTPHEASGWNYQVIDLSKFVGYFDGKYAVIEAGFTDDTVIDNEDKWYGYINGSYPDGWTADVAYATFGATAAKELFASLPTTGGGNNTVKLISAAASAIPKEAMTSLTEEDIAVATAKGWTITLV